VQSEVPVKPDPPAKGWYDRGSLNFISDGARSRSNLPAEELLHPPQSRPDLILQSLPLWQLLINDDVDSRATYPCGLAEPLKIATLRHGRPGL
jgi:hypothetical protein